MGARSGKKNAPNWNKLVDKDIGLVSLHILKQHHIGHVSSVEMMVFVCSSSWIDLMTQR